MYYTTKVDLGVSQNFIVNSAVVRKLIAAANFSYEDIVLDIGAGTGILTGELAAVCKKVYAFEADTKLEYQLRSTVGRLENVEIVIDSFLNFDLTALDKYNVFSNIPFSISTDIFTKLFFSPNTPTDSYLFLQSEAALRFMGKGEGTMLSLLIKPFFDMSIVHKFLPSDFSPQPSVDTVLLRVKKLDSPLIPIEQYDYYKNFIIYTLVQQKPTLKLRLNKVFTYEQFKRLSQDLKFNLDVVASTLTLEQWLGLFNYYLIGVIESKKQLVDVFGFNYINNNQVFSGPSRTKIRK